MELIKGIAATIYSFFYFSQSYFYFGYFCCKQFHTHIFNDDSIVSAIA